MMIDIQLVLYLMASLLLFFLFLERGGGGAFHVWIPSTEKMLNESVLLLLMPIKIRMSILQK